MALEFSTAGVTLGYCAETTAGTRPTASFTNIPGIKGIPSMNESPNNLQVTDLSDTVRHRYIPGLVAGGDALAFNANLTAAFKTAWEGLMTAYATAKASGKAIWFEVKVPGFFSFYFTGAPVELGMPAMEVDAVLETEAYIVPNTITGWATSST